MIWMGLTLFFGTLLVATWQRRLWLWYPYLGFLTCITGFLLALGGITDAWRTRLSEEEALAEEFHAFWVNWQDRMAALETWKNTQETQVQEFRLDTQQSLQNLTDLATLQLSPTEETLADLQQQLRSLKPNQP